MSEKIEWLEGDEFVGALAQYCDEFIAFLEDRRSKEEQKQNIREYREWLNDKIIDLMREAFETGTKWRDSFDLLNGDNAENYFKIKDQIFKDFLEEKMNE